MSIRVRLAGAFACGTAIIYAIVALVSLHQLKLGLDTSVDSDLRQAVPFMQRAMLAQVIETEFAGVSGAEMPNGFHVPRSHGSPIFAQLLNRQDSVIASIDYPSTHSLLAKSELRDLESKSLSETINLPHKGGSIRLYARKDTLLPNFYLVMADPLGTGPNAQNTVGTALLIFFFPVVALAAIGGWILAHSALRPVEKLRLQAEEILDQDDKLLGVPKTKDELARLASTMNNLLANLHKSLTTQRSFISDAGHELRTPLAILQGELELALKPGRTVQELQRAISEAAFEAQRLAQLSEDLLVLARGDEGHLHLRLESKVILSQLEEVISRFNSTLEEKQITTHIIYNQDLDRNISIELDSTRIQQALANILDNSIRYSPPNSDITVEVTSDRDNVGNQYIKIMVRDNGPGFPPDFLPHAFERFRRPNSARDRFDGGTGLGLAIVKSIVEAHGGQVGALNNVGHGGALNNVGHGGAVNNVGHGGATVWLSLPMPNESKI